ncbi:MAG: T6SS effector amidase Tae4 family protein [Pseudomonadota bacterium]
MKPTFKTLNTHYYSSNEFSKQYKSGADVYAEMGIDLEALIKRNPAYVNTCAARVSLALLKSKVSFTGRLPVKAGPFKGKKIEPGAKLLADQLKRKSVFGMPEVLRPSTFFARAKDRKGVVLFWKIADYGGGHIDLIETKTATAVCRSGCYFKSKEIWFWPLS